MTQWDNVHSLEPSLVVSDQRKHIFRPNYVPSLPIVRTGCIVSLRPFASVCKRLYHQMFGIWNSKSKVLRNAQFGTSRD